MKKVFFLSCFIAMLCSCNSIVGKVSELTGKGNLKTDSIVVVKDLKHASVRYYVDFPTSGNSLLVNAIREFVNEQLGGTFDGEESDGKTMINTYAEQEWQNLVSEYDEMASQADEEYMRDMTFYTNYEIRLVYETDKFVTYQTFTDTYLGGAHGMQNFYGVTFRKSDGRRFGYSMMRQLYSEGFKGIIKEGLRKYFAEGVGRTPSDAELKEWLMTSDDINYLSQPRGAPYMMEDGVKFLYQPYEIAPYAGGMPEFTVSYNDIKPYLTIGAQKLLP